MKKSLFFMFILFISIAAVAAEDLNEFETSTISNYDSNYYVDLGGDDSNLGNANSPFNSIKKAISESNSKNAVTIHLNDGVFKGQNNTMLTINKAHISQGGSITIVGNGPDKTFIDGENAYYVFNVKSDTILYLKDLSIINCKSIDGGAIENNGELIINNCLFKDNRAISDGGAIHMSKQSSCTITDSTFENNLAHNGGAIYSSKSELMIDNCTFIKNKGEGYDWYRVAGGAIYISDYYKTIPMVSNSRFINNSATSYDYRIFETTLGGSIYMQRANLINDTFINSSANGNLAKGGSYYSDPKYLNTISNILRINSSVNGVFEENIFPQNYDGEYSSPIEYYVSPKGDDLNGNGSKSNPFNSIKKAIDESFGKTNKLTIYLLEGVYKGLKNLNLNISKSMNINFVGLDNVILDGEEVNYFIVFAKESSQFKYEFNNLKIINCKSKTIKYPSKEDGNGIITSYSDIFINNCVFEDNIGLILSNFDYSKMYVNNSKFVNNDAYILFSQDGNAYFNNSLINNTNKTYLITVNRFFGEELEFLIENTTISNSICSEIMFIGGVKSTISNSFLYNNGGYCIVANDNPQIDIINSIFKNGKGFKDEMKLNVINSKFINNSLNEFRITYSKFSQVLFLNNSNLIFNGNNIEISNSAFYNPVKFTNIDVSNNININYNYWEYDPEDMISGYDVPEYYILKTLTAQNLFNGSYKIFLNYNLNNGANYNIGLIPILNSSFKITTTNGQINPKNGILTKSGFEAIGNFNNQDQTIKVIFDDNTELNITILNQHQTKVVVGLSKNQGEIEDIIKVSIQVFDLKTGHLIKNGVVKLYLDGLQIDTLINDDLSRQITISGKKSFHNISAIYVGDDNYATSGNYSLFRVSSIPLDVLINSNDIVKYYKNDTRFTITLKDVFGNILQDTKIIFNINGVNYTRITNKVGVASIAINLNPGEYNITTYYLGNSSFDNCTKINKIFVLSTLNGINLTKIFKNESQYFVKVLDNQGNPLVNEKIEMNINGVFYYKTTNSEGLAKLNINLKPGQYILTVRHPNTELMANLITVIDNIVNYDLGMFYKDGSRFAVKILDNHGNPLFNANVTFNINGVFYNKITNKDGFAYLNINLLPGDYIITTYYGSNQVGRNIHIDPMPVNILSSQAAIYRGEYYNAIFSNALGKPIVGEDVIIMVNNNKHVVKTNNDGMASLKMDFAPGVYRVECGLLLNCYESKSIYSNITVIS